MLDMVETRCLLITVTTPGPTCRTTSMGLCVASETRYRDLRLRSRSRTENQGDDESDTGQEVPRLNR